MADSASIASSIASNSEAGHTLLAVTTIDDAQKRDLTPGEAKIKQSLWDFYRTLDYNARRTIFTITDKIWADFLIHLLKLDKKSGNGAGLYLDHSLIAPGEVSLDDSHRTMMRKRAGERGSG